MREMRCIYILKHFNFPLVRSKSKKNGPGTKVGVNVSWGWPE